MAVRPGVVDQAHAVAIFANWTGDYRTATAYLDLSELQGPIVARSLDGDELGRFDGPRARLPVNLDGYAVTAIILEGQAGE